MSASIPPINQVPLPIGDPIAAAKKPFKGTTLEEVRQYLRGQDSEGFLTQTWLRFFSQQQQYQSASPVRIGGSGLLTGQSASIGSTDMSGGSVSAGLYIVQAYARITTPATTGAATSSLTVTLGWTDSVPQTESWTALTGNATTTKLTNPQRVIYVDGNTSINYSTTYASDTAGQMQYKLQLIVSRLFA